ncbi:hypothetical protein M2432_000839 [Mycobacterium sp. OTB74]|nr:hypothetical protein [Mycobacterium sp. OTB74]
MKAWNESNPNAREVHRGQPGSTKHEQGGWILVDPTTGKRSVKRVPRGSRDGLGPIVGTRPTDSATQRVVAWFHTHPNTDAEGYGSGPSPADIAWQNAEAKVPGIILTHDGTKFIPFP